MPAEIYFSGGKRGLWALVPVTGATRYAAADKLRQVWQQMDAVDEPALTEEELAACIKAVRAAHRAQRDAQGRH